MYRLYRIGNTIDYAIVPKDQVRLMRHLMREAEYEELRTIIEDLEFTVVAPGDNWEEFYRSITSRYKVLAELDDDRGYYVLVEV